MSRGYGATAGVSTSDVTLVPSHAVEAAQMTWALLSFRRGAGNASGARMVQRAISTPVTFYLLHLEGNGTYRFGAGFSTTQGQWTWTRPNTGGLASLVITYDGSLTTNLPILYVDGASQGNGTALQEPVGTFTPATGGIFYFGNVSTQNREWDGWLDHFALWNRLLAPSEIGGLRRGQLPTAYPVALEEYVTLGADSGSRSFTPVTHIGSRVGPDVPLVPRPPRAFRPIGQIPTTSVGHGALLSTHRNRLVLA